MQNTLREKEKLPASLRRLKYINNFAASSAVDKAYSF